MRFHTLVSMAVLVALLGGTGTAQQSPAAGQSSATAQAERLDAADHAERMARIALTGDLGFPPLPPVYADSPKDDLLFADRFPVGQGGEAGEPGPGDGEGPFILNGWIPAGESGTGTPIGESFRYQEPLGYDPFGAPVPMVIAYHGYGASAVSVHQESTIDEEANARGWFYLSVTGMDDQLFGTPISQQNTSAAIQWMLDNYNIDVDRLYMVGFSMGGGVVANFAARHRDPDGLMIAALGVVSASYDWEQAYNFGSAGLQALMENEYNFGGPPFQEAFRYHQASDLRFLPSTYPPPPGTLDVPSSMATNLGSTPTWIVWDTGDTIADVRLQGPFFVGLLQSVGATVDFHTVSGTVDPSNGSPSPHSWAVLDEVELFDFFDGKVVDRTPAEFSAQLDASADVSWLHVDQRFPELFAYADGAAAPGDLSVDEVSNATYVAVDFGLAGLTGPGPFDVYGAPANVGNFQLRVTNLDCPPAYFLDATTGLLHTGTLSDPLTGTLIKPVNGGVPVDLQLVCDPAWTTSLTTHPNPTFPGGFITLDVDAPDTSQQAWLVVGVEETLTPVKGGHTIVVGVGPPASLIPFPLDANGDLTLNGPIPSTPALSGTNILLQTIGVGGGASVDSISNLWVLKID